MIWFFRKYIQNLKRKRTQVVGDNSRFQIHESLYEGVNLECVRDKYTQILNINVSKLSQKRSRQYFQHIGGILHERSDCSQNVTTSLRI